MILKNIIDNLELIGPVLFEYKDIQYNTSTPTIDDFLDDSYQYLLYKNIFYIEPRVTEFGVELFVKLID